jgi:hypothetical protein
VFFPWEIPVNGGEILFIAGKIINLEDMGRTHYEWRFSSLGKSSNSMEGFPASHVRLPEGNWNISRLDIWIKIGLIE